MNDKEYTYDIDKYTIGVDENGEDGIGLTVAKVENGEIYFLGNCYGENAKCIDLLIKENQELKKQVEDKILLEMKLKNELFNKRKEYQDTYKDVRIEIKEYKTQQKEFINYLEDEIKSYKNRDTYIVEDIHGSYDLNDIILKLLEEILQKYKEIVGAEDD